MAEIVRVVTPLVVWSTSLYAGALNGAARFGSVTSDGLNHNNEAGRGFGPDTEKRLASYVSAVSRKRCPLRDGQIRSSSARCASVWVESLCFLGKPRVSHISTRFCFP